MARPFAVVAFQAVSLEGAFSGLVSLVAAHIADHFLVGVVPYCCELSRLSLTLLLLLALHTRART